MRELHKAETDPAMKDTIEDVVQLLIKKEEEINADNLISDVEIPEDVAAKLEEERAQLENLELNSNKQETSWFPSNCNPSIVKYESRFYNNIFP